MAPEWDLGLILVMPEKEEEGKGKGKVCELFNFFKTESCICFHTAHLHKRVETAVHLNIFKEQQINSRTYFLLS
jgi:hypothetical protein